ncbi:MAG: tetratricopeptide repeat protein, partial [Chloroflexi bacterium]|nr:tetratricopeptide repeat protein [Chloroflexota bacterium]
RGMAVALSGLGDVAAEQGEYAVAWKYLAQALTLAQQVEDIKLTLQSLVAVAALLKKQGRLETAFPLLAFVLAQEATPQETRDRAEPLRMELDALDLLPRDAFWADEPSLADVVTQILHLKA